MGDGGCRNAVFSMHEHSFKNSISSIEVLELWFGFRHLIKRVIRRTGLWLLSRPHLAAYFYSILPQHHEWFEMIGKIISTGKVVSIHEQKIVQNLELIIKSNIA